MAFKNTIFKFSRALITCQLYYLSEYWEHILYLIPFLQVLYLVLSLSQTLLSNNIFATAVSYLSYSTINPTILNIGETNWEIFMMIYIASTSLLFLISLIQSCQSRIELGVFIWLFKLASYLNRTAFLIPFNQTLFQTLTTPSPILLSNPILTSGLLIWFNTLTILTDSISHDFRTTFSPSGRSHSYPLTLLYLTQIFLTFSLSLASPTTLISLPILLWLLFFTFRIDSPFYSSEAS
jgi:hypothetical protein